MTKLEVRPSPAVRPIINRDGKTIFGNTMDLLLKSYNSKEEQAQENYWIYSLDLMLSHPPHLENQLMTRLDLLQCKLDVCNETNK